MGRYSWSFWGRDDASRRYSQNPASESDYHECVSGIDCLKHTSLFAVIFFRFVIFWFYLRKDYKRLYDDSVIGVYHL